MSLHRNDPANNALRTMQIASEQVHFVGYPIYACDMTPRHSHASKSNSSGFTLVELLVVLAILGLLLALAFSMFRLASGVGQHVSDASAATSEDAAIESFLRRAIGGAYPAHIIVDPMHDRVSLQGSSDRLEFTSLLPHIAAFGHQRVALYRDDHNGKSPLILVWAPERDLPDSVSDTDKAQHLSLLPDIASIKFQYYGEADGASAAEWRDDWQDRKTLPKLIRVTIARKNGEPSESFDVAPRLDVDANCLLDLLTYACRGR